MSDAYGDSGLLVAAPGLAVATVDTHALAWGRGAPVLLVSSMTAALVPYLTGTVALAEVARDVIDEAGEGTWTRCLSELGLMLSRGLLSGHDPGVETNRGTDLSANQFDTRVGIAGPGQFTLSILSDPDAEPEPGPSEVERRTLTTEFADSERSLGELVDADSCVGKRIDSARRGESVYIDLGSRSVGVQTNSARLAAMLRACAPIGRPEGPVEVFSVCTTRNDGSEGKTRLFDGAGELFALADDFIGAAASIDAMLTALTPARARGVPLIASGFGFENRVVLIDREVAANPALLRSARRAGITPYPARRYVLTGGHIVLPDVGLLDLTVVEAPLEIAGLVSWSPEPGSLASSTAAGLLGHLRSDDDGSRRAAMESVLGVVGSHRLVSPAAGLAAIVDDMLELLGPQSGVG